MLNIITGALARDIFGPSAICQLGIPEIRTISDIDYEEKRNGMPFSVSLISDEDRRIDLSAELKEVAS